MIGKQIWTFEQIEKLGVAISLYGLDWKRLQQLKNAYYKFKKQEPELFRDIHDAKNIEQYRLSFE